MPDSSTQKRDNEQGIDSFAATPGDERKRTSRKNFDSDSKTRREGPVDPGDGARCVVGREYINPVRCMFGQGYEVVL